MKNMEATLKGRVSLGVVRILLVLTLCITLISCSEAPKESDAPPPAVSKSEEELSIWTSTVVTFDTVQRALFNIDPPAIAMPSFGLSPKNTGISVSKDEKKAGQKDIEIVFVTGTFWDETDLVKKVGGTMIEIGSILFQNKQVEEVTLVAGTNMTDQYGKTEAEAVVIIKFSRNVANKVDWKGLAERHLVDPGNIYRIANYYYIHPGVLKNVNLQSVKIY